LVAAGTLTLLALFCRLLLKEGPSEIGAAEQEASPDNLYGAEGNAVRPEGLGDLLGPLLSSPAFWLVLILSATLTLIRETFNAWSPNWLVDVGKLSAGEAGQWSAVFPLVGAASALVIGRVFDRFPGRQGRVLLPGLILLVAALAMLATTPLEGRPVACVLLLAAVAAFLLAPYTLLSGVMAMELGGRRGSATAAGLIDAAGYLGGVLAGSGVIAIAKKYNWSTAFGVLAGIAAVGVGAAAVYSYRQEFGPRAQNLETAPNEVSV
jgi:OPA family glycerol-3-phosphate transporter-like MFS transporter